MDTNNDEQLSVHEFGLYVKGATESKEKRQENISADMKAELVSTVEKLFKKFDAKNLGSIDYLDLKAQLTKMGVSIDLTKAREMVKKVDTSGTGKINY